MPEENRNPLDPNGAVSTAPAPLASDVQGEQNIQGAAAAAAGAPASPPLAAASPPPPPPPPPSPPPPPAEPEKDWTDEDPARDASKAPKSERDPAYWADPMFFRLVIYFAGWVLILAVGGMLLLAANDKEIPQGIVAAASGLVGLLTGIFAAKSSQT